MQGELPEDQKEKSILFTFDFLQTSWGVTSMPQSTKLKSASLIKILFVIADTVESFNLIFHNASKGIFGVI